MKTYKEPCH